MTVTHRREKSLQGKEVAYLQAIEDLSKGRKEEIAGLREKLQHEQESKEKVRKSIL